MGDTVDPLRSLPEVRLPDENGDGSCEEDVTESTPAEVSDDLDKVRKLSFPSSLSPNKLLSIVSLSLLLGGSREGDFKQLSLSFKTEWWFSAAKKELSQEGTHPPYQEDTI